jgi:hypothetical protein
MGTNMMPQQTPDSPAEAGGYPPAFGKAADQASTALASMFKICHQQEPDSPLCDALQNMIKAVAEIETRAGMPGGGSEPAPEDQGMPPEEGMPVPPEGEAPAAPMGGGNTDMAQAAQEAHQMMLAEQAKKRPMGA